jgi:hypothetical protein
MIDWEAFNSLENQIREESEEEIQARIEAAPEPIQRIIRAIDARNEAAMALLDAIGVSENIELMFGGMALMSADMEFDDALGGFLNFVLSGLKLA